ncbi:MAG: hypothetical protein RLZZ507_1845 [Cyanobacteriota bacterium]|jgi:hypothetical protein
MKNRFTSQIKKIRQPLNQVINNLLQNRYWRKNIAFKGLLALTLSLVVIFAVMTIENATTQTATAGAFTYETSWLGNTIGKGKLRVQNNIEAMYVTENGQIYTNSIWDEAGGEAGIYKDGKVIGFLEDLHGWYRLGGKAVTANSKYIYVAMSQGAMGNEKEGSPPQGKTWYCVRRYNLAGKPVPFAGGNGWDKSMFIISEKGEVTGLATVGNKLFVSNADANIVRILNTETMQEMGKFAVTNPGGIAIDPRGTLWIIQNKKGNTAGKIVHYDQTGKKLPQQIGDVVDPTAIAIYKQDRLLVAENGIRQQVLIYNIKNKPVQVGTFGAKNGIYSGVPGEVGNLKLYGITAVGADSAGNLYINNNGFNRSGTDLRKFSSSGKLQWQLLGLIFVDNADTDPKSDGVNLFTKHEEYLIDYSKPAGKKWTYKAYTLNPFKYPQDPRLHTSPDGPIFRRIQGKPFLFLTDMFGGFLQIYRFQPNTDGKIAIPAGLFVGTNDQGKAINGNWPPHQPTKGEWIWRDKNGNGAFDQNEYDSSEDYPFIGGWWVDTKGDVWKTLRTKDGIRHYPLQGLDSKGNPIYTYSSMQKQKTPSIFGDLRRIEYFPETDTMYLSGFTLDHPSVGDDTGVVGSEIARFDNWSQGNRTPRWRTVVPYDNTGKREISTAAMSVAGNYVFAVTVKTAEVYVYNAATGKLVHKFGPGPEVGKESGWVDIPHGIRAFRRANGEYLVFVEENLYGKVIIYRFRS